jgi:hypothetical protein
VVEAGRDEQVSSNTTEGDECWYKTQPLCRMMMQKKGPLGRYRWSHPSNLHVRPGRYNAGCRSRSLHRRRVHSVCSFIFLQPVSAVCLIVALPGSVTPPLMGTQPRCVNKPNATPHHGLNPANLALLYMGCVSPVQGHQDSTCKSS